MIIVLLIELCMNEFDSEMRIDSLTILTNRMHDSFCSSDLRYVFGRPLFVRLTTPFFPVL